ncbi:glycosyltransferase family 4 protein [Pedobacter sp. UC225_61]|uniref:glycosyltransferase family 4 protein n=1 Tax=Pedobacter sp. UC225_61 TaxID=3374623 RepID=UPI0037A6E86B
MNKIYIYLLFFVFLFLMMAVYFKIATKYNIIDKPNARSSHTLVTVRGGGIIFPIAAFLHYFCFGSIHPWFLGGLLLISIVSFIDDITELNGKIRLVFQFIAMTMLLMDFSLFDFPLYIYLPLLILGVATINAWNFMDGINGITGGYSLLTLATIIFLKDQILGFASTGFTVAIALALLVFIFYNFRTQARCFAGDVGSVSIAFIIVALMIKLVKTTENPNYILFILIYGLDSATTVFFRILRKESILEPHRSHLYQYLANEKGMPHNTVAMIYILIQLAINILVISLAFHSTNIFIISLIVAVVAFVGVRFALEGSNRLLGRTPLNQN